MLPYYIGRQGSSHFILASFQAAICETSLHNKWLHVDVLHEYMHQPILPVHHRTFPTIIDYIVDCQLCEGSPLLPYTKVSSTNTRTLLEKYLHITNDDNAWLYVTKCSTFSLYLRHIELYICVISHI